MIEYFNFLILFVLYVMCIEGLEEGRMNAREVAFVVYALGEIAGDLADL